MNLSKLQKEQLEMQLKQHNHKNYDVDLVLNDGDVLKNFAVHSSVLRPEKMTALTLARWLFFNNGLFANKAVLDMGAGSGIQGAVCGLYGAKRVTFNDLSPAAFKNTEENIKRFGLEKKSRNFLGDLFENITGKFDVIVFNHPFFSDQTIEELLVVKTMKARGKLIHKFFEDAKKHLTKRGIIIMPYFHLAGPINDPAVQAPEHGYNIFEAFSLDQKSTLQKGKISIYILKQDENA